SSWLHFRFPPRIRHEILNLLCRFAIVTNSPTFIVSNSTPTMKKLFALYHILLSILSFIHLNEAKVADLTPQTFQSEISSGFWFIKFFAPWCPHCKRAAPHFVKTAKVITETVQNFHFGEVNCDNHEGLCDEVKVEGIPTFFLFHNGKKVAEFDDDAVESKLVQFCKTHANNYKKQLERKQNQGQQKVHQDL
ncbi:thioredoxin-like protein, partial [Paraphysoderma sedebokerense]